MRTELMVMTLAGLMAVGCGKQAEKTAQTAPEPRAAHRAAPEDAVHQGLSGMPDDAMHRQAMAEGGMGTDAGMHGSVGVNTEIHLDPAIRAAWRGVTLRVVNKKSGAKQVVEAPIGTPTVLGDTGLTATVDAFVPDFVMGADGIGTRSPQPNNPAAHLIIEENGKKVFDGWLFAKMPDIHPFSHEVYQVLLAGGIPAGSSA